MLITEECDCGCTEWHFIHKDDLGQMVLYCTRCGISRVFKLAGEGEEDG